MSDVRLDQTQLKVGETLTGSFIWTPDNDKQPKDATVSIGWYTEGRGTRNKQTVLKQVISPTQLSAGQGRPISFSLALPDQGPVTYNGSLICLIWELRVVVDLPGLFARDDKMSQSFMVSPRLVQ